MHTKIIVSSIVHKRYGKIEHFFKYKVPSLFIDLDELEIIKLKSKIFSINSFNIFSFNEKDHGYRDDRSIREIIIEMLQKYVSKALDNGYSNFIILGDWNDDLRDLPNEHSFQSFFDDKSLKNL